MEIARIFYEGGYDRIVCSTEGPMAQVALFLQQMFNVPSYFFMHTDWIDLITHTTNLNLHERDRVRRLLRAPYHCKGPKDIIEHEVSGYLVEDLDAMAEAVVHFFSDPSGRSAMAEHARKRAASYQAEPIMRQFLMDLGLEYPEQAYSEVTVA